MRRSLSRTLLQSQDVCFFCAFRYGLGVSVQSTGRNQQIRTYKSSLATHRPAAAVAARVEEEDEDYNEYPQQTNFQPQQSPQPSSPRTPLSRSYEKSFAGPRTNWTCQCGRSNRSNTQYCAECSLPRPVTLRKSFASSNTSHSTDRTSSSNRTNARTPSRDNVGQYTDQRKSHQKPEFSNGNDSKYRFPQKSVKERDPFNESGQDMQRDGSRHSHSQQSQKYPSSFAPAESNGQSPQRRSTTQQVGSFRRFKISEDRSPNRDDIDTSNRRQYRETSYIPQNGVKGSSNISETSSSTVFSLGEDLKYQKQEDTPNAEYGSTRNRSLEPRAERRSLRFEIELDEPTTTNTPATYTDTNPKLRHQTYPKGPGFDADAAENSFYETDRRKKNKRNKRLALEVKINKPRLNLPDFITVEKLARSLKVKIEDFMAKLEEEGFEGARHDHILDSGTSAMFAELYGFDPIISGHEQGQDLVARPPASDPSSLPPRPPIVTIMGHVDHGKTTILDWLRKSSVVESEHGGITQHIGAFSVTMPGTKRQITFLDTPGHAAFLDMRRRGANVTDIVVLVVAADDSVKPQTIEAIKHALEAKVQVIVAINKIDKEEANIDRVKQDLSRHDITVEDFGGEYQAIPVSGKTGRGMEDLEEAILTLADVSDFRAETDGLAEGWIIESKVTIAGRVATVLIRRGTLRPGDFIVAGTTWARVRTLRNDAGQLVSEALPGMPVQIDGWRGDDPTAGLEVLQAENEEQAKDVIEFRQERVDNVRATSDTTAINASRTEEAEARAKVLAWEAEQDVISKRRRRRSAENEGWVEKAATTGPKPIHFVIKADVAGSVEALVASVGAIGNREVTANIIHSGTGILTESDIRHLATTGEVGYAISFNQSIDKQIQRLAEAANLQILDHNIIYKVTDEVKEKLAAELPPLITQRVLGEAEIGQIFDISTKKKKLKIAGCKITNGTINRSEKIRVLRKGEPVYTGMLDSLKNVKKDVTEMRKGTECGMAFDEWEDFQEGDQIQSFEEISQKRTFY